MNVLSPASPAQSRQDRNLALDDHTLYLSRWYQTQPKYSAQAIQLSAGCGCYGRGHYGLKAVPFQMNYSSLVHELGIVRPQPRGISQIAEHLAVDTNQIKQIHLLFFMRTTHAINNIYKLISFLN